MVFIEQTLSNSVSFFELDLSPGAACFGAEANSREIHTIASKDETVVFQKDKADWEHVVKRLTLVPHFHCWEFYGGREKKNRRLVLTGKITRGYIQVELPHLPFANNQSFDAVISSYL